MDRQQAEDVLAGEELAPIVEASIDEAKRLLDAFLADDIAAILGRDQHCQKGCSPKVRVYVREPDLARAGTLLHQRFRDLVVTEGTLTPQAGAAEDGEPPCPACGAAGPLVDGACADCGLVLG